MLLSDFKYLDIQDWLLHHLNSLTRDFFLHIVDCLGESDSALNVLYFLICIGYPKVFSCLLHPTMKFEVLENAHSFYFYLFFLFWNDHWNGWLQDLCYLFLNWNRSFNFLHSKNWNCFEESDQIFKRDYCQWLNCFLNPHYSFLVLIVVTVIIQQEMYLFHFEV